MRPKSSILIKFFKVSFVLVLGSILGSSIQSSWRFFDLLQQQERDRTISLTESTAAQLSSFRENWTNQIALFYKDLLSSSKFKESVTALSSINPDLVGIGVFKKDIRLAKTDLIFSQPSDQNKADYDLPKVLDLSKQEISKIGNTQKLWETVGKGDKKLFSFTSSIKNQSDENTQYFIVAYLTASPILEILPSSKYLRSQIVTPDGRTLVESYFGDNKHSLSRSAVNAIKNKNLSSGYIGELKLFDTSEWLLGFSRIGDFGGLTLIVERDPKAAGLVVFQSLLTSALWALLFILVAVALTYFSSKQITQGIRHVTYATQRIAQGDFSYQINRVDRGDEVGILSSSVNQMSRRILKLLKFQIEKVRMDKELETAQLVQKTFFPGKPIITKNLAVAGFSRPATECGGDLWGHFTAKANVEVVFIADAMGHGVPSALATAVAYAAFTTLSDLVATDPDAFEMGPASILERVNRILFEAVKGKISMTCFIATFNFESGELLFANAGHNFPFTLNTSVEKDKNGKVKTPMLRLQGDPLGIVATQTYTQKAIELQAGDKVFLYTDGLFECKSADKIEFGKKNFIKAITEDPEADPIRTVESLKLKVDQFFTGTQLDDDVTVVVAEVGKNWKKTSPVKDLNKEIKVEIEEKQEESKSVFSFDIADPQNKVS